MLIVDKAGWNAYTEKCMYKSNNIATSATCQTETDLVNNPTSFTHCRSVVSTVNDRIKS